jgi:hypothetical protein
MRRRVLQHCHHHPRKNVNEGGNKENVRITSISIMVVQARNSDEWVVAVLSWKSYSLRTHGPISRCHNVLSKLFSSKPVGILDTMIYDFIQVHVLELVVVSLSVTKVVALRLDTRSIRTVTDNVRCAKRSLRRGSD